LNGFEEVNESAKCEEECKEAEYRELATNECKPCNE